MKKNILIVLALLLLSFGLRAQETFKEKKKSKTITYDIFQEKSNFIYRNEKNKLYKANPIRPRKELNHPSIDMQSPYDKFPYENIHRILAESLTLDKIRKIQNQTLFLDLYCSDEGNVQEITVLTARDSPLSVNDVERIEVNLKEKFHVTITNKFFKGSSYILISYLVDTSKLLKAKKSDE